MFCTYAAAIDTSSCQKSLGAGITCGSTCSQGFAEGTRDFDCLPALGSSFSSWIGSCTGTDVCTVTMDGAVSVTATFSLQDFSVTPASTGLTAPRGDQATDVVTITGLNGGFGSAIEIRCAVAQSNIQPRSPLVCRNGVRRENQCRDGSKSPTLQFQKRKKGSFALSRSPIPSIEPGLGGRSGRNCPICTILVQ